MRITILSRNGALYSTKRLVEAARGRGHKVRVIDYLRCYLAITEHRPAVIYRGEVVSRTDAVIPRIGAPHTFYGTAVVRQFEMARVFAANESAAIIRSRDKLWAHQLLARAGIGLPITGVAHSTRDIDGLIETVGGAPLIVKLLEGTQGMGVVLAETRKAAESVIGAFRQLDADILVQEFVDSADHTDIRALVVGGEVVGAMLRRAPPGEFRSNLHRGGRGEPITLTSAERGAATRAAAVMGLDVAGVDLLRSKRGPLVIEVNSSPGLEGIETITGIDVASRIVEFIEGRGGRP